MDTQTIKKNFLDLKEIQGLSWADLAQKAGVTNYQTIFNRLNGKGLTIASLEKLANLVNCEPYQLLKPQEPQDKTNDYLFISCPHCSKKIYINIEKKPNQQEQNNHISETLF